jgi:hypothetical protein
MAQPDPINFVATYDDTAVSAGINKMIQSVDKGQEAFDDLSKSASNVGPSFAASIATAQKENEALKNGMLQTRAEILRLERQYTSLTNKSGQNAKAIKAQIVALQQQNKASSFLFQQNTNDIKELGRQAKESFGQAGQSMALTTNQAQNLTFQFNDLFSQVGAGTSIMQALIQQGPQITQTFGGLGNTLRFAGNAALGFFKRLFTLKGGVTALSAGLVALTGVAVASYFRRSQEAADNFEQTLGGFREQLSIVGDRVVNFGESIVKVFTGEAIKGEVLKNLTRIFSDYGDALSRANIEGQALTARQQVLDRTVNNFIVTEAKAQGVVDKLRDSVSNSTLSINERTNALRQAGTIESGLEKQRIRDAQAAVELLREQSTVGDGRLKFTKEIADAEKKVIDLRNAAAARERSDQAELRAIREERARKLDEEREKVEALNKAYQSLLERLSTQANKASAAGLTGLELLRKEQEIAAKELAKFVDDIRDAAKAAGVTIGPEVQAQIDQIFTSIQEEFVKGFKKLTGEQLGLKAVETELGDGLEGAANEAFKRLGVVFSKPIDTGTGLTFSEQLQKALGLDDEGLQKLADALSLSFSNFVTGLNAATEAQISAQDRIIERRREQVDELKALLEDERRQEEEGYAFGVAGRKEELAEKQALLEAAEKKRAALEEKAARRTLIINSVQQASEATLTIARLLSASAKLGIFGFIAAAAVGVSTVFSILAQAKAQSAKFAQAPGFKEGTPFLDGAGTGKSDSIPAYLSRGERVMPAHLNEVLGGAKMPNDLLVKYALSGMDRERETAEDVRRRQANIDGHKYARDAFAGLTRDDMAGLMKNVIDEIGAIPKHYYGPDGSKVVERKKGGKVIRQTVKAK